MELLKTVRRKTFLSEVTYYALNIILAVVLLLITLVVQTPYVALVLVFLSKWRVLAVRPRFWWTNIQANFVDFIVGVSVVILMYLASGFLPIQIALTVFFAIWLVIIKPMSKQWQMTLQATCAVFLGTMALFSVAHLLPDFLVVLLAAAIGYSSARHILFSYKEDQLVLLSSVWGIIFAEVAWLAHHWTFAYGIPGMMILKIPQVTIVLMLICFLGERAYTSWRKNQKILRTDMTMPLVFSVAVILVMFIFFNTVRI